MSELESCLGFASTEPLGDGEEPGEPGGGEPLGEGLGEGEGLSEEGVGVGVTEGLGVAVGAGVAVGVGVAVGFGVITDSTRKYPAATIPIRTIGSRIKSQSLLPPPPGPFTTASDCPHSGHTEAPSKRIWSPV